MSAALGKLAGKAVIASGSGRDFGRAVALKLARRCVSVDVNDLDQEPAFQTVAFIEVAGGTAGACVGNVGAEYFGERVVRPVPEAFEGLDQIVNSAGYTRDGAVYEQTDEQFTAMLDVHFNVPFRILRAELSQS